MRLRVWRHANLNLGALCVHLTCTAKIGCATGCVIMRYSLFVAAAVPSYAALLCFAVRPEPRLLAFLQDEKIRPRR